MQKLVNHIYWSTHSVFYPGSHISVSPKLKVDWSNSLMSPGKPIITWRSSYNFQGDRAIPQLPILQNGRKYRIRAHLTSKPLSSYLIRITFFDLQGTEIKRVEFRSHERSFVYPKDTVTYQIEIINTGMTALHFDRLDICDDNLSKSVHDDIWIHRPVHVRQSQPLNIILVKDGKQARKTYPILDELAPLMPIQIISIDWQYEGNIAEWFTQWLAKQKFKEFHLVSTNPDLDRIVWNVRQQNDNCEIMLTHPIEKQLLNYRVWDYSPQSWQSPNITEPNWQKIIDAMNSSWGWRFIYDV